MANGLAVVEHNIVVFAIERAAVLAARGFEKELLH
jgi:hypothetical protein